MMFFIIDYLEYYLILVFWIVNNGIWVVLVFSGVFVLFFVVIIVQEWFKVCVEGVDEGNKGVFLVVCIENWVFVVIVVVMFVGIFFIDVDFNIIQYDSLCLVQCQVNVLQFMDIGWFQFFSIINNQSVKVLVWWVFMYVFLCVVISVLVVVILCGIDL